jgi:DNA polymerase-3 subunit gamma/tau
MSHLALYRKYRPASFADVRGQSDAVSYLESIAQSGRVPHAILLTGSRGIGKTTLARIFGKSLGIDAHDIYEIDAASYRKVENMRELLNDVLTLPISSPYKLYILDEVHMLTNESFNTFLKTLEEPPRHVIFVLATTELNKVLPTVLSRCQVIHLKKPSTNTLADQIIDIAKLEEKSISREHALLLAERANGSFRDALVLLDQVLEQSSGKEITDADIQRLGLRASDYLAFEFITALAAKDSDKLFQTLNTVSGDGKNLSEFLNKLLQIMRTVLYVRHAPGLWKAAQEDLSDQHVATIEAWSSQGVVTSDLLARFLRAYEESKRSTIPAIPAELAIIEILSNNTNH